MWRSFRPLLSQAGAPGGLVGDPLTDDVVMTCKEGVVIYIMNTIRVHSQDHKHVSIIVSEPYCTQLAGVNRVDGAHLLFLNQFINVYKLWECNNCIEGFLAH